MRHLTAADYLRTPWKNGGGETVQLAIFPADAGLDDFAWRISVAGIYRDGPFSRFAGIDRSLVVLSGSGVLLDIDGMRHELTTDSPPLRFAGSAETSARLIAGPVTDFNVMSRAGVADHSIGRMAPGETVSARSGHTFVFAPTAVRLSHIDLRPGEMLALEADETVTLQAGVAITVAIISKPNAA